MKCDEARVLLLEAELEELEGRTGSALSDHVRACSDCAAAAARILRANAELDALLSAPVDEDAVAAVMARLAAAAGDRPPTARGGARAGWRRSAWGSLALAASVAGLLFLSRAPTPVPERAPDIASRTPTLPLVEHAGAATVAVIETDNPDITVLWFF